MIFVSDIQVHNIQQVDESDVFNVEQVCEGLGWIRGHVLHLLPRLRSAWISPLWNGQPRLQRAQHVVVRKPNYITGFEIIIDSITGVRYIFSDA